MQVHENEHVSGVQKDAAVPKDSLLRSIALFYLRLESEYYVPSSTVQRIVEEIKQLTDHCKEQLKEKLLILLGGHGLDAELMEHIAESIRADSSLFHKELSSVHLRKQLYQKNFLFNLPVQVSFSPDDEQCNKIFYYVPILDTLKSMFQDRTVVEQYLNPVASQPNVLETFQMEILFAQTSFFKIILMHCVLIFRVRSAAKWLNNHDYFWYCWSLLDGATCARQGEHGDLI